VIVFNQEKCTGCGFCAKICHESCIRIIDKGVTIDDSLCSTCTQCVAVCPQRALSWDGVLPSAYERERMPSTEQLAELFKERRSVRFFQKQAISRETLQEVVRFAADSPTNNYHLRLIVVDGRDAIELIDQAVLRYVRRIYAVIYRPRPVYAMLKGMLNQRGAGDKVKVKIEQGLASHGRSIHEDTAAIVFVVGDARVPLSIDSAQHALSNVIYYAQAQGIGSCLWGNGRIFLNGNRAVRKKLGLRKHEKILGSLLLGYPSVKFSNKVEGKTMPLVFV